MIRVALIGNPNCGKTTLFNALTGARQRVGNWPGVTVEQKTGWFDVASPAARVEVVDLPGIYSLTSTSDAIDEQIARDFVEQESVDVIVNVVDASTLARGLYLTSELVSTARPVVVALNMMDVARKQGMDVDVERLASEIGVPVVPVVASRDRGIDELTAAIASSAGAQPTAGFVPPAATVGQRYSAIDATVAAAGATPRSGRSTTDLIDSAVLNRYLAFPLFLAVMYLMFLFTIHVGSAFIDFFELLAGALFVEAPRLALQQIGAPGLLTSFIADGVGGGIRLVATFIPVIGCLFLALSLLEDSGYMGRVAFIIDRLLQRLGLPGKSFVPLIVGFGCNVPAVMATRTLDNEPDRILTTLMAPFMSCGARLTVYVLFAAAFFPTNGQNVVFVLYLIGVVVAIGSAFIVRRHIVGGERASFVLELPAYHLPTARGIVIHTWHRLKGFVLRAGKAIVIVVIVLNGLNSVGTDGSVGNQNTERSVLSEIGKAVTPAFAPIGIEAQNWPATVGIFTGIFAKEVVVGTLDALYAPETVDAADVRIVDRIGSAFASVPDNLRQIGQHLGDPLGIDIGDLSDPNAAAADQDVSMRTLGAMRTLFGSPLAAFSYLLFILLYMPCIATIGAIYKEIGAHWAWFSTAWSFLIAYLAAMLCFQLGQLGSTPLSALLHIATACLLGAVAFWSLVRWGRARHAASLIPVVKLSS